MNLLHPLTLVDAPRLRPSHHLLAPKHTLFRQLPLKKAHVMSLSLVNVHLDTGKMGALPQYWFLCTDLVAVLHLKGLVKDVGDHGDGKRPKHRVRGLLMAAKDLEFKPGPQ